MLYFIYYIAVFLTSSDLSDFSLLYSNAHFSFIKFLIRGLNQQTKLKLGILSYVLYILHFLNKNTWGIQRQQIQNLGQSLYKLYRPDVLYMHMVYCSFTFKYDFSPGHLFCSRQGIGSTQLVVTHHFFSYSLLRI